jgi:2-keto-4-pentenoate hydratase
MLLNDVNLRTIGMTLRKNGTVVSTGAGAACLGNPVNAIVWLANKLGELGAQLNTGQVILSGALGPVSPVVSGDRVTVEIGRMGRVGVGF